MKDNLKRLMAYYKPYKKSFWLDRVCAIISAAIALVIPFMVRFVVFQNIFYCCLRHVFL